MLFGSLYSYALPSWKDYSLTRVADPHHFNADPDSVSHQSDTNVPPQQVYRPHKAPFEPLQFLNLYCDVDLDSDPAFHFNADLDPAFQFPE